MADPEFEELTRHELIPEHIRATAQAYTVGLHPGEQRLAVDVPSEDVRAPLTPGLPLSLMSRLVHDVNVDEELPRKSSEEEKQKEKPKHSSLWLKAEYVEAGDCGVVKSEPSRNQSPGGGSSENDCCGVAESSWGKVVRWERDEAVVTPERRRRKLPEIPIFKKTVVAKPISLAEELGSILQTNVQPNFAIGEQTRPLTVLKCHSYLRDEDSSPDSDRFHSTDVDSGNSTAHSPDCVKSVSPQPNASLSPACSSPPNGTIPFTELELLDPTHRGLYKFVRRHRDEMDVDIGDPIYVHKEADDLWCEGINLRTGKQGIFPSAYVVDVDYNDFDPNTPKVKRERFILGYMGSVETTCHKGNSVLCQAVKKIKSKDYSPYSCILEVSDTGLRMVDRKKPQRKEVSCHDYFYSLKNVSFCAFHPRDHRYLGFITKHPQCDRFACHVFVGTESTRPVAEAVGRAFQRFYQKFLETAYPVEDIYIEEPLGFC